MIHFLNDLPNASKLFETVHFADDSIFVLSYLSQKVLEEVVNTELGITKDCFGSNGLSINISKTTFLQFCSKGEKKRKSKNQIRKHRIDRKGAPIQGRLKIWTEDFH